MTGLLVLQIDRDSAGHLAVALRRHRADLAERGWAEPPGLADLQEAALRVVEAQERSGGLSGLGALDDDVNGREFLTLTDVSRLANVSVSTVKRWVAAGALGSSKRGVSAALPALTLTGSSRQRDLRWLRTASSEEIDQALEAGELNVLLGQPLNSVGS